MLHFMFCAQYATCFCAVCCVNCIHDKMYRNKEDTKVRTHKLRGSGKERTRWFRMLMSIRGWHMRYWLDNERMSSCIPTRW